MHTYRKTEDNLWTVGFNYPDGWHAISDFNNEWEAAATTSYLNGGLNPGIAEQLHEWLKPNRRMT